MDSAEDQIGAILNDPEKMQKIMALAQSFQSSQPASAPEPPKGSAAGSGIPEIDPGMLKKLSGFASHSGIDKNQRNLLNALSPYLSRQRIQKLERAMRAAKLAGIATTFLGNFQKPGR